MSMQKERKRDRLGGWVAERECVRYACICIRTRARVCVCVRVRTKMHINCIFHVLFIVCPCCTASCHSPLQAICKKHINRDRS